MIIPASLLHRHHTLNLSKGEKTTIFQNIESFTVTFNNIDIGKIAKYSSKYNRIIRYRSKKHNLQFLCYMCKKECIKIKVINYENLAFGEYTAEDVVM